MSLASNRVKKWGIGAIAAAIIATAIFVYIKSAAIPQVAPVVPKVTPKNTVVIHNTVISVEVVDTDATREKGLGDRESLAENTGMLFVFPKDDTYGFWMKD